MEPETGLCVFAWECVTFLSKMCPTPMQNHEVEKGGLVVVWPGERFCIGGVQFFVSWRVLRNDAKIVNMRKNLTPLSQNAWFWGSLKGC